MEPTSHPWYPNQVNVGNWLTHYTVDELESRIQTDWAALPICSLGTPYDEITHHGMLTLPPLYREALDSGLKAALLDRILHCFPYVRGSHRRLNVGALPEVVELPTVHMAPSTAPRVLAFSVDTAVEQHGPHLPLATDTIQSYAVLRKLAGEFDGFVVGPPVDYGHLTWGLPRGFSIDIGPELLERYVTAFVNAVLDWAAPEAI